MSEYVYEIIVFCLVGQESFSYLQFALTFVAILPSS